MTKQQTKKIKTTLAVGFSLGLVVLFVGHGCSGVGRTRTTGGAASLGQAGDENITIFPNTKTVSTVYSKQFLDNMVSCTGLGIESSETKEEYKSQKGSLSEYGYATDVTPPMLMAIATVAGEVCSDIIDGWKNPAPEKRQVIFDGFNLNGSTNSAEIRDAIQKMALSCWQRPAEVSEVDLVANMVEQNTLATQNNGEASALLLCTAMLSSYKAIEM